jgi:thioredoxin reductase (NADPH)
VLIPPDRLHALIVAEAELGERIVRALILRRAAHIESGGSGPVLIGDLQSPDMLRLENFCAAMANRTMPSTHRRTKPPPCC